MATHVEHKNIAIPIPKNLLLCNINKDLIHQVINSLFARTKVGTKSQKSRAEVSGSGRKPWRQKGTGRARVGSTRNPIWRSGGVTFAAQPNHTFPKINKKMYKLALKGILSELIVQQRLTLCRDFAAVQPKTKSMISLLKELKAKKNTLIITEIKERNLILASRNIYNVTVTEFKNITPLHLVSYHKFFAVGRSTDFIEGMLK